MSDSKARIFFFFYSVYRLQDQPDSKWNKVDPFKKDTKDFNILKE